jgi:hypothetical protein
LSQSKIRCLRREPQGIDRARSSIGRRGFSIRSLREQFCRNWGTREMTSSSHSGPESKNGRMIHPLRHRCISVTALANGLGRFLRRRGRFRNRTTSPDGSEIHFIRAASYRLSEPSARRIRQPGCLFKRQAGECEFDRLRNDRGMINPFRSQSDLEIASKIRVRAERPACWNCPLANEPSWQID